MRKIFLILLLITIVFSIEGNTFAYPNNTDNYKITYQTKKIVDLNKIMERAKKEINESPYPIQLKKFTTNDYNSSYKIYKTTQKIKEFNNKVTGQKLTTYSTYIILQKNKRTEKENEDSLVTIASIGHDPKDKTDSSISYTIYINFEYEMLDNRWVKALEYSYRWDQLDPYVINYKTALYTGASGLTLNGDDHLLGVADQFYKDYPSSDTWYNNFTTDYGYVSVIEDYSYNGMNVRFDFDRRGTKFYDELAAGFGVGWMPPLN